MTSINYHPVTRRRQEEEPWPNHEFDHSAPVYNQAPSESFSTALPKTGQISAQSSEIHLQDIHPVFRDSSNGGTFLLPDDTQYHGAYDLDGNDKNDFRPAAMPKKTTLLKWFYFEMICLIVALASLGAQVGVLLEYDGKPQNTWSNSSLTLNGLIAILATICRAAFMVPVASVISQARWIRFSDFGRRRFHKLREFEMFDDASRGPWGSLQLLWEFKGLHISCLGAALTILSLAFSTFSQQLITVRTDRVPDDSQGQAGVVSSGRWVKSVIGYSTSWAPLAPTKLAMYEGFMSPNIDIPQVVCPTGNCTWPIIPTVGVCGSCVNLTDEIQFDYMDSDHCRLSLESGLTVSGWCGYADFMTSFEIETGGSGRVFESSDPRMINSDAPNLIIEFGALGIPRSKSPEATLNESLAAECALWYCLQAHEVSMQLGELSDTTVATWGEAVRGAPGDLNANVTFTNVPGSFNVDPDQPYGVAEMQMYTMRNYANNTIFGNVSTDGAVGVVLSSTDYAEGMHNSFDDVDAWIARLARSMTNDVRVNGTTAADGTRYRGTVLADQVLLVVRWGWIAYPAGLMALMMAYLAIEMVRTAHSGVGPWKSDVLLPVCMQIDEKVTSQASEGLGELGGIAKRIGDYRVRMKMEDNGIVGFDVENNTHAFQYIPDQSGPH